jgi:hypothetical protein
MFWSISARGLRGRKNSLKYISIIEAYSLSYKNIHKNIFEMIIIVNLCYFFLASVIVDLLPLLRIFITLRKKYILCI